MTAQPETIRPKRRWASVLAMAAAAFVDTSEDQSLGILWPQMRLTLGLSVGQLGQVLSVSRLVRTLTLPGWGYAADHFSRKALLVGITGLWGLWTVAVGFVDSLSQLLVLRTLSSLGLAVLWPTAFSLLSDLFPSKERGRAAGVMTAVSFAGDLAAFGILPAIAIASPEAWRMGFVLMGVASSLSGLLLLVVNDPPRGSSEPELSDLLAAKEPARQSFRVADLPAIARVRSWWVLLLHKGVDALSMSILYGWVFTWLHSLGLGSKGFVIVGLMGMGTLLGHVVFGWLGDVLEQRFPRTGRVSMALVGLLVTAPAIAGFIGLGSQSVTLLFIFGVITGLGLSSVDTGARWPIAQGVLLPELRGTGRATIDMITGILGAAAIWLSGLLADQFGVTTMLLIMLPVPKLLGALTWIPMFRTYPHDRAVLHQMLEQRRALYMPAASVRSAGEQESLPGKEQRK